MIKKLKETTGISMLEVLVSMLILSFGVLGLAPLITIAIYNNSYSGDMTEASNLARQEVEFLLGQNGYGALPDITVKDSVGGVYQVVTRIDDNSSLGSVPGGVYKVDVVVNWTDEQNQNRSVEMASFKPIN